MNDVVLQKLDESPDKSAPLLNPLPYGGMSTIAFFESHRNGGSGSGQAALGTALTDWPDQATQADQEDRERLSSRVEEKDKLQGSPSYRLMAPSEYDPSEDKIHMKHDEDNQINNDSEFGSRDLPDPTAPVKPPTPVRYIPPSIQVQQRIGEVVKKEDLARLSEDVTTLYDRVQKEVQDSRTHATQALTWLNEARGIIMGRPELFTLAELRVNQTQVLLQQLMASNLATKKYQTRLVCWNLFWLILFMGLFALDSAISNILLRQGIVQIPAPLTSAETLTPSLVWYFQPWLSVLVGGIGGALAAITTLGRAISRREYDPALNMDYYLNVLKGVVLGGVVYYILLGGFITAAATSTINTNVAELTQRVQVAGSPLFILMAFLAGFAQQRILALLPQVWGNVTGSTDNTHDTHSVTQAAVEAVPIGTQPMAMGTLRQLPYSYNGADGGQGFDPSGYDSQVNQPYQAPDGPYYGDDPTVSANGQKQDDFTPFSKASP